MLSGISDLWQEINEHPAAPTEGSLTKAHKALTEAHAGAVDAARQDFGG